jgi:hypothetical protein
MIKTIEGIYQNGQVRFTKLPQGIVDHQVLLTLLCLKARGFLVQRPHLN